MKIKKDILNAKNSYNWAIIAYFIIKIIISEFLPSEYKSEFELGLSTVGLIFIPVGLWNLFTTDKKFKSIAEIITNESIGAYIKVILLLSFTRLDSLGAIGSIAYMTITLSLLTYCFFIVVREFILTKTLINSVMIAHIVFGYLLFLWSKDTYVRNYGNEVIGSFWEKPNYRTKYTVKVSENRDFKDAYTLQAQVHISVELKESVYPKEDSHGNDYFETYTRKYIIIEKVFWPDGVVSEFESCDLENSNSCVDQNNKLWYVRIDKKL